MRTLHAAQVVTDEPARKCAIGRTLVLWWPLSSRRSCWLEPILALNHREWDHGVFGLR